MIALAIRTESVRVPRRSPMIRFSLFGIPIEIQPWFWVILALIGGALGAGDAEAMLDVALFVLAGFLSVLVHELGHALTGKAFGAPTRIVLHSFGGYATFPANSFSRGQNLLVTAAGPAIQILLGLAGLAVLSFAPIPSDALRLFFYYLFVISIFWALLNLIPVIPLDGGQLLASILGPRRGRLALWISLGTAIGAAVLLFKSFGSFLFPIFLGMMAYQNYQALQQIPKR